MKTLRLFGIALFAILLSLTACSGGDEGGSSVPTPTPETPKSEIKIDSSIATNGVAFKAEAGEQSITFNASDNWTLSVANPASGAVWCTASTASGTKGSATVKFTVTENKDYEDRSVAVTIKSGTASTTFTITQKAVDAMLVTTTKYEVPQTGGNIEVEVQANITYQVEISESSKDWIKETTTRALTANKHTFEIAANEEYDKREGEIIFKSGDKKETVKVYQTGGAIIMLTQNEYAVSDKGETITVELKSNCEYGVKMPNVDWIKEEVSRAASSHTLKYIIAANEGYDSRSAEIVYFDKNSDLKDTLTITQGQKNAIILSNKNIEVDSEGGDITVKLSANVDFEIEMPPVDWITKTDSRALTEHEIKFTITKNENEEKRSVNVVFVNKENGISEKLTITQRGVITNYVTKDGDNWVVTKSKGGNLLELLKDDMLDIISLKIIGPLNGDDIKVLRQMFGGNEFLPNLKGKLVTLDIANASIIEGGDYFYVDDSFGWKHYSRKDDISLVFCESNLQSILLPNSVTTIGINSFKDSRLLTKVTFGDNVTTIRDSAFENCEGLINIVIPSSVTIIGSSVFRDCKGLTNITIPNSVTTIGGLAFENCKALTNIKISENLTTIGIGTFQGCEALASVTIPNSVTTIKQGAFHHCKSLTNITIPNSVTTIGEYAFYNCDKLSEITCLATPPPALGETAFTITSKLYVPKKSVSAYREDENWSSYFNTILPITEE